MTTICGGVWLTDINIVKYLIQMLGFIEAIDQLAVASNMHWYRCVLRREDVMFGQWHSSLPLKVKVLKGW